MSRLENLAEQDFNIHQVFECADFNALQMHAESYLPF